MPFNPKQYKELKAIIASVYYLESEARRAGLKAISSIFKMTLAHIEKTIVQENPEGTQYQSVVDCELYKIMTLLDQCSKKNKFDLQEALKTIEFCDKQRTHAH